jgi:uncharacterized protein (UPF0335 family)
MFNFFTYHIRLKRLEQDVAKLNVEVREIYRSLSRLEGRLDVDMHLTQLMSRISVMEESSSRQNNSIGRLEGQFKSLSETVQVIQSTVAQAKIAEFEKLINSKAINIQVGDVSNDKSRTQTNFGDKTSIDTLQTGDQTKVTKNSDEMRLIQRLIDDGDGKKRGKPD